MEIFKNELLTDDMRNSKAVSGIGEFEKCEFCGFEHKKNGVGIRFYHKYKAILCDRCVDNHDGVTVWSNEYAAKRELPPYPGKLKESTFWKDMEQTLGYKATFNDE